jgi:hypothetical protein
MKKALLPWIFSAFICCAAADVTAQKDRFAYAVTGTSQQSSEWNTIRRFDLQTGAYSDFVFDGKKGGATIYDAQTKKPVAAQAAGTEPAAGPFSTGVAAMAYDKAHHRLYFAPMMLGQLRYLDLRTQKLYYLTGQLLADGAVQQPVAAKVITRMVIAPDGWGYAITNDGEQMMRFSTGRNPRIIQMGALIDAPENGGYSVHSPCTGYGGDMVADDAGNLMIITAQNHLYKITPANRQARYMGTIKSLPAGYTVNGAVVDDAGRLLVSSGVDASDYYLVQPQSLEATPVKGTGIYKTSDLANSNFLQTQGAALAMTTQAVNKNVQSPTRNIQVFPNPASGGNITVQFHKIAPGDYTIHLTDVLGRSLQSRQVTIAFEGQTQSLNLPRAKGVYLVRVADRNSKLAHEEKVVVQ